MDDTRVTAVSTTAPAEGVEGGPERTAAADAALHLRLPGDWVAVDTSLIADWRQQVKTLPERLEPAASLLDRMADAFRFQRALLSAVLVERGGQEALATLACFHVGLPAHPGGGIDLVDHVRAAPPPDAVEGTFTVDTDERAGGRVRSRCLRTTVLEAPSGRSASLFVEYFVPVPGENGMLIAAFSTPNAAREGEYLDLFSRIAASIEID